MLVGVSLVLVISFQLTYELIFSQVALFQTHPHLKQFIRPAVERAVQEWIHPVVDRSIKIALTTCEQIVKKDFALDSDETRMRAAAHHMVRNLTAGMAMITCRDQLLLSISGNLKQTFLSALMVSVLKQRYSTFYVHVPPHTISLQICTLKVVGA